MIDAKVTRRINLKRQAWSTYGQDNASRGEDYPFDAPPTPIDGDVSEEEDAQESDMLVLRWCPSRKAKLSINYRRMMGREDHVESLDCTLLSSVDPYNSFSFSSTSSSYIRDTYLVDNDTIKDMHTCAFIAKVWNHNLDDPTYKETIRWPIAEKIVCEEAMTKELKSLADLGSFEMISR